MATLMITVLCIVVAGMSVFITKDVMRHRYVTVTEYSNLMKEYRLLMECNAELERMRTVIRESAKARIDGLKFELKEKERLCHKH